MSIIKSNIYKKYFPIENTNSFYNMEEKEISIIAEWIKYIEREIHHWNVGTCVDQYKRGRLFYKKIFLLYSKSPEDLSKLLSNKQFWDLDTEDLILINDVLYRHKYNSIISMYIFPTKKNESCIISKLDSI